MNKALSLPGLIWVFLLFKDIYSGMQFSPLIGGDGGRLAERKVLETHHLVVFYVIEIVDVMPAQKDSLRKKKLGAK